MCGRYLKYDDELKKANYDNISTNVENEVYTFNF